MKICRDGRISGQNNREAGNHLGILTGRRGYIKKGKTHSETVSGSNNPMYGRKHSMEARREISKSLSGVNHYNWKGGISSLNSKFRRGIENRLWRDAVFARDNWTCQECSRRGGRLVAHHIKSFSNFPELRFAIDNGKTLCFDCHKLSDNYKGKGEKRK